MEVVHDSTKQFTDEMVKKYLLVPYYEMGSFMAMENNHSEKGKYKPMRRSAKVPPEYNEWKNRNGNDSTSISSSSSSLPTRTLENFLERLGDPFAVRAAVPPSAAPAAAPNTAVFTFSSQDHAIGGISVFIDNEKLKMDCTMKDLLLYSDDGEDSINDEFDLDLYNEPGKKLYFHIEVQNGRNYVYRKNQFLKFTANKIITMNNVMNPGVSINIVS